MTATQTPKRFVGYVRVSTDEQREFGQSLDAQKDLIAATVMQYGGRLDGYYGGSESAMGKKPRPHFRRLIEDAKARKFDAVCVASEDRLFRNVSDQELAYEVLLTQKIDLIVGNERVNLRDASTQLVATFKAKATNLETRGRLDSSARGRIRLAALGFATSGGPPFGRSVKANLVGTRRVWESDPKTGEAIWRVDPEAKRYVQKAAKLYLSGKPWSEVAELVEWPHAPRSAADKTGNSVRRRVLEAGADWEQVFDLRYNVAEDFASIRNLDRVRFDLAANRAIVRTPVPPLLDDDTIRRVRERAQQRYVDRKSWNTYALSRFLRCAGCGSSLSLHTHRPGVVYIQHHHVTRKDACPGSFGQYPLLERDVLYHLGQVLRDEPKLLDAVRAAYAAEVPELAEIQAQKAEADADLKKELAARDRMRKRLQLDLSDDDAAYVQQESKRLAANIDRLTAHIAELASREEAAKVPVDVEAQVKATVRKIRSGYSLLHSSPEKQRAVIKSLFGERAVRNRPANAKEAAPPFGVFLGKQTDPDLGQPVVVWTARGEFFNVGGAVTSIPEIADRYTSQGSGGAGGLPDTTLSGVASGLGRHASKHADRRWSASACP